MKRLLYGVLWLRQRKVVTAGVGLSCAPGTAAHELYNDFFAGEGESQ